MTLVFSTVLFLLFCGVCVFCVLTALTCASATGAISSALISFTCDITCFSFVSPFVWYLNPLCFVFRASSSMLCWSSLVLSSSPPLLEFISFWPFFIFYHFFALPVLSAFYRSPLFRTSAPPLSSAVVDIFYLSLPCRSFCPAVSCVWSWLRCTVWAPLRRPAASTGLHAVRCPEYWYSCCPVALWRTVLVSSPQPAVLPGCHHSSPRSESVVPYIVQGARSPVHVCDFYHRPFSAAVSLGLFSWLLWPAEQWIEFPSVFPVFFSLASPVVFLCL